MADAGEKAAKQLKEITECPICMSAFTDPRMLPCIHTFCFECLKRTGETALKKPGDKMPCPLCRKEFIIPLDGVNGLQKNFFMKNLLECKSTLQMGSATIICDMCNVRNEGKAGLIPKATMTCLACQDNYCDSCVKVHQFQKLNRNHQVVKIGSDTILETKRFSSVNFCTKHTLKTLDYYCADCKKIVCVSCFVESHASHKCKDVTTVDEEFRQTIEKRAWKTSTYVADTLLMRRKMEMRKADFLQKIEGREKKIYKRNQELKDIIDRHTKSLVDELSVLKSIHLKKIEYEMEEIDRCCAILRSFESYCTELRSKGSASDICSSVDQLIVRADELEKDHKKVTGHPRNAVEVTFKALDLGELLQKSNSNLLGKIEETIAQSETCAVVVGINDGRTITKNVMKINLHLSKDITAQEQIPTTMAVEAVAAVYSNTMYVTGIGGKKDEIWKYKEASIWVKCASLVQGRRRHSAAFIDEVLYICGGLVDSNGSVLDSVEAYNAITGKCSVVGKLAYCVQDSGNCLAFKSSLYIFGGADKDDNNIRYVQMYDTKHNTCSLISKRMPRPLRLMRAVLWKTTAILVGCNDCFLFNLETETWQEREQFKTDVVHFGLVLDNERVFVIGGGKGKTDKDDKTTWSCRDDIRYVSLQNILEDKRLEWKLRGKLPKPSLVQACAKILFPI